MIALLPQKLIATSDRFGSGMCKIRVAGAVGFVDLDIGGGSFIIYCTQRSFSSGCTTYYAFTITKLGVTSRWVNQETKIIFFKKNPTR